MKRIITIIITGLLSLGISAVAQADQSDSNLEKHQGVRESNEESKKDVRGDRKTEKKGIETLKKNEGSIEEPSALPESTGRTVDPCLKRSDFPQCR